ncbi:hypothetical protein ACWEJ6_42270 [Nonomuraea sp. NPDC004702]
MSSLVANATVVGIQNGSIGGNTLTVRSPGGKADPGPTVITFRVKPGPSGAA